MAHEFSRVQQFPAGTVGVNGTLYFSNTFNGPIKTREGLLVIDPKRIPDGCSLVVKPDGSYSMLAPPPVHMALPQAQSVLQTPAPRLSQQEAVVMPVGSEEFLSSGDIQFQFGSLPEKSVEKHSKKSPDQKPDNYDANFPALSASVVPQSNESLKNKSKKESNHSLSQPVVKENTAEQVSISSSMESAIQSSVESASPEPESVQIETGTKVVEKKDYLFNDVAGKYSGLVNAKGEPKGQGVWKKIQKGSVISEVNAEWKDGKPISGTVKFTSGRELTFADGSLLVAKKLIQSGSEYVGPVNEKGQPHTVGDQTGILTWKDEESGEQKSWSGKFDSGNKVEPPKPAVKKPVQSRAPKGIPTSSAVKMLPAKPMIAAPARATENASSQVRPVQKSVSSAPALVKTETRGPVTKPKPATVKPLVQAAPAVQSERLTLEEIGPPPNYYENLPPEIVEFCQQVLSLHMPGDSNTLKDGNTRILNGNQGSKTFLWHSSSKPRKDLFFFQGGGSRIDRQSQANSFLYVGAYSSAIACYKPAQALHAPDGPGVFIRGDGAIFFGVVSYVTASGVGAQMQPAFVQGKILMPKGYIIKINAPVLCSSLQPLSKDGLSSFEIYTPKTREAYGKFIKIHSETAKDQFHQKKKYLESVPISESDWQQIYSGGVVRLANGQLAAHDQAADLRIGNYAFRGQLYNGYVFEQRSKIYLIDAEENKTLIYEGELHSELHEPKPSPANLGRSKMGYFYTETKNYYGAFSVNDEGRTLFSGTSGPLPAKGQPAISTAGHRQIDIAKLEPSFADIPPIVLKMAI